MIGGRLSKISKREQVWLGVAVILLFVMLLDNLVARPLARRLEELDREIKREINTVAYNRGALKLKAQIEADFEQVKGRVPEVVSPARDLAAMKEQIDEAARKNGLMIGRVADRDLREMDGYVEYAVEVGRLEGELRAVLRFMCELWDATGLPRVVRMNLKPNPAQGGSGVTASLVITKLALRGGGDGKAATESPAAATGVGG